MDAWAQQNRGLTGDALVNAAQQQGFDPAFIALLGFPQVLDMMAQHVDDYAAIGAAFSSNQGMVMDSVQRLRSEAYASGALRSDSQLQVTQQPVGNQQVIVIQPANQQVVYVPQYDPEIVYAGPSTGAVVGGLITFGAGIAIGAAFGGGHPWGWGGWGWNWGSRVVLVNRRPWAYRYNRYRPPRPIYRPRPIRYDSRPGYGGHWGRPGARPNPGRPNPGRPNPGVRPPGRPNLGSPSPSRPSPSRPNTVRPNPAQPNPARPSPGVRPPNRTQPIPRPIPTARPTPATRPAPTRSPYAGFPQANRGSAPSATRQPTGARPSAFGGSGNRAASARGKQSSAKPRKH